MKKRLIAVILTLAAMLSLLAGCAEEETPKNNGKNDTKTENTEKKDNSAKSDSSAALAAPVLTISAKKYGTIYLKWEAVDKAVKYVVYRRAYDASAKTWGSWEKIKTTKKLTLMDSEVTPKVQYAYRAKAIDENNEKSAYSEIVKAKAKVATIPFVTVASEAGSSCVKVSLRAVDGVKSYGLYRRAYDASAKAWGEWEKLAVLSDTTYTDTAVDVGAKYGYRATSVADDNTESGFSNSASVTVK